MLKRLFDFIISVIGLAFLAPILVLFLILIFITDFGNPLYIAQRVGKNNMPFNMVKLRSMRINADKSGLASTSSTDSRITKVGHYIRKYKLDEFTQLINVLKGDMSLVGPRPNVRSDVDLYTSKEKELLSFSPGITDLASIVYSDEGDILKGYDDADLAYQQLIRPGKGKLGIFYINNQSFLFDLQLIFATLLAVLSKEKALNYLCRILENMNAGDEIIELVSRKNELTPQPPLGSQTIFTGRN